jgi:hypothetical protein
MHVVCSLRHVAHAADNRSAHFAREMTDQKL